MRREGRRKDLKSEEERDLRDVQVPGTFRSHPQPSGSQGRFGLAEVNPDPVVAPSILDPSWILAPPLAAAHCPPKKKEEEEKRRKSGLR